MIMSQLSSPFSFCLFLDFVKSSSFFFVVVVGVGHSAMPLSFIELICSWFSGLSNPPFSVLATQGVHPSGSVKGLLFLDRRGTPSVFSVFSSFVSELSLMSIRHSFFWFRNISSVLAWDVVGEYSLESMTIGSNNFWFVSKFIFHWSSSSVCLSSYFQRTSSSVKYLALSSCPSGSVVNELTVSLSCLLWFR